MAGPILMLAGLDRVTGLTGALVLNLEAPFTLLLPVAFFGEHLGRGAAVAAGLIMAGAAALDWTGGVLGGHAAGPRPSRTCPTRTTATRTERA